MHMVITWKIILPSGEESRFSAAVRSHLGVAAEIDGHERYPDHAGRVHGEADELSLVEVLRDVPRLEGVQSAKCYQEKVEGEGNQHSQRGRVARQDDPVGGRVLQGRRRRLDREHRRRYADLDADEYARYQYLRTEQKEKDVWNRRRSIRAVFSEFTKFRSSASSL